MLHPARADPIGAPVKILSQEPDMLVGLDYSSEFKVPSLVADDWTCSNSLLPVTDIHWWGSYWKTQQGYFYYSDHIPSAVNGGIVSFTFKIWGDIPGPPFSQPDGDADDPTAPLWT